ncbi:MAG: OmpA/MotB domain-containing protein [Chloroflexi bacterium]|nr:MAG: OmpA/MotB domain-containing protein [Chloroflexota bacterium]MBA4376150.1 hypothetical protein [Anaerolinea sp.]
MQSNKGKVGFLKILIIGLLGVLLIAVFFVAYRYLKVAGQKVSSPAIEIILPQPPDSGTVQQPFNIKAIARERGDLVTSFQFYVNGFLAGSQTGSADFIPGNWNWTPTKEGVHTFSFLATNQSGIMNLFSMDFPVLPMADADSDGVADASDACPSEEGPALSSGCLLPDDIDRDGLTGSADVCPEEPGIVETKGCPSPDLPDSDRDGVPDPSDSCPGTPGLLEWDGCPPEAWVTDLDGDVTPDFMDTCPESTGSIEASGCPVTLPSDRDGDGVNDIEDRCIDEPGPASNGGCPVTEDRDGDGVPDSTDLCPDLAGLASYNGCRPEGWDSDEDADGVMDYLDRCFSEPGPIENFGCPYPGDRDGDGILDEEDNCPALPGPADNNGCPRLVLFVPGLSIQDVIFPGLTDPCALHDESCDFDGDGLTGDADDCPYQAGMVEYRGCPAFPNDQDGDGISDAYDECVTELGDPIMNGCPVAADPDRDTILGDMDDCPDQAGPPENHGCPRSGRITNVELHIVALITDPVWAGVYCYAQIPGQPTMLRLPERDWLFDRGSGAWNLGSRNRVTFAMRENGQASFKVFCWGQPWSASEFSRTLGEVIRTHRFEDWDGQIRAARGVGAGGWFEIHYRMCRNSCR